MNTHQPQGPGIVPRQVPHLPSGVPAGWQVAPRRPNNVTAELAGGGYLVRLTVGHNQLTLNRPEVEAIIECLEAALPRLPIELAPQINAQEQDLRRERALRQLNDPAPTHQCRKCRITTICKVTYPDPCVAYCARCGGLYLFVGIR